jgi:hypothetical protein
MCWTESGRYIACGRRAGVLLGREELQRAAELTRRAGAWLVLDNTYGAVRRPRRLSGGGLGGRVMPGRPGAVNSCAVLRAGRRPAISQRCRGGGAAAEQAAVGARRRALDPSRAHAPACPCCQPAFI